MDHKSTRPLIYFTFPIALLWFQSPALRYPNCIHCIPYVHGTRTDSVTVGQKLRFLSVFS